MRTVRQRVREFCMRHGLTPEHEDELVDIFEVPRRAVKAALDDLISRLPPPAPMGLDPNDPRLAPLFEDDDQ